MADKRYLKTKFWRDPYTKRNLNTMSERMIYAFLLLNDNTSQCGVFEIIFEDIAEMTLASLEEVSAAMAKLEADGKIKYDHDTKEVFIVNYMKHNPPTSPKLRTKMLKDMKAVKSKALLEWWHEEAKAIGLNVNAATNTPNPNVKVLVEHYSEAYKRVKDIVPEFSKADFGVVGRVLIERKNDVERLKNIVEFGIDLMEANKLVITLKGVIGHWSMTAYRQAWAKHKWAYTGLDEPPTDKQWWRG
jgi:DNA-binding Lrp family transcriptional regulator